MRSGDEALARWDRAHRDFSARCRGCGDPVAPSDGRRKPTCEQCSNSKLVSCNVPSPSTCVCGKRFLPKVGNQKFCSVQCRESQRPPPRYESVRVNGKNARIKDPIIQNCAQCSLTFSAFHPMARFCSLECGAAARYAKASVNHICVECGSGFVTKQNKATCCGQACLRKMLRRISMDYAKANPRKSKYASRSDAYRIYDLKRRGTLADFRCAEIFPSEEIFVRDQWMCKICHDPIDRSVKFPHPRSVSLDHIVPLSKGGKHVRKNVQTAHFGCNSRKGAKLPTAVAG